MRKGKGKREEEAWLKNICYLAALNVEAYLRQELALVGEAAAGPEESG